MVEVCDVIRRDDVLELLYEIKDDDSIPKNYGTILDLVRKVREMPTALDVEKIVDEIRDVSHGFYNMEVENEIVDIIKGAVK